MHVMHRRFCIGIVLAVLVGCGSTEEPETEEQRAARERRRAATRAASERKPELPVEEPVRMSSLLEQIMDADGRGMCNLRLVDAARTITATEGTLHRWTALDLERRFPERTGNGNVVTYLGNALEFMEDDGTWVQVAYECDYDHDAGEIVGVRTNEW